MTDEAFDHVDPYADGTYGKNHTPASTELERDQHKEFSRQQAVVMRMADVSRSNGITGADIKDYHHWETNAVSRSLSNLLRDGALVRLKETRGRAHVHVLPRWVDGRETLPYQSSAAKNRRVALMEARAAVMGAVDRYSALSAIDDLLEETP